MFCSLLMLIKTHCRLWLIYTIWTKVCGHCCQCLCAQISSIKKYFSQFGVEILDCPAQSPDLNLFQHLQDELEGRCEPGLNIKHRTCDTKTHPDIDSSASSLLTLESFSSWIGDSDVSLQFWLDSAAFLSSSSSSSK